MSLVKSLTSPLAVSLLSDGNGNNYSEVLPAGVELVLHYPLKSDLVDAVSEDVGVFSRASTSSVTDWRGNTVNYAVDEAAFTQISMGFGFGSADDDLSVNWPTSLVNDFCIYFKAINWSNLGNPSTAAVLQNRESGNNQFIVRNSGTGSDTVAFFQTVGGVVDNVFADVSSSTFDCLIIKDSTNGVTIITPDDEGNNPAMTDDAITQPTTQVGSNVNMTVPYNGYMADVKLFSGTSLTLNQARKAV